MSEVPAAGLRIAHVIDTLDSGGAERALVDTVLALSGRGIVSTVLTLWGGNTLAPELERAGIEVRCLVVDKRWSLRRAARQLATHLTDADLVHCHLYFAGVYTGLVRQFGYLETPAVITFHNLAYAPGCNPPGPGLWLRKSLNRLLVRRQFDAAVAVSDAVAEHYREHLGLDGIEVIPNPVDSTAIDPFRACDRQAVRARFGFDKDVPLVLLAGRLVHEKGHAWFLEAIAGLRARALSIQVVFVGSGPLEELISQQVRSMGLGDCVRLLPQQERGVLLEIMCASDVLAVPSLYEGFGLVAAEAMCLELPVVASRVGGLVELLAGDAGVLVEAGDTKAMTDALADLLQDAPRRQTLGQAGRARIDRHYSLEAGMSALLSVYRNLVV